MATSRKILPYLILLLSIYAIYYFIEHFQVRYFVFAILLAAGAAILRCLKIIIGQLDGTGYEYDNYAQYEEDDLLK